MIFNEVNTGIYAWDILDEGMDRILDVLQEDIGLTALYITALMHSEKRPHKDVTYKHNPVRKYFIPNDARAYWKPNPAAYKKSKIKPRVVETEGLADVDWLKAMTDACRKRGIKTGVSMSHTPLDKERAQGEFSDCVQRDVFGNALSPIQLGKQNKYHSQLLCWNNPSRPRLHRGAGHRSRDEPGRRLHPDLELCSSKAGRTCTVLGAPSAAASARAVSARRGARLRLGCDRQDRQGHGRNRAARHCQGRRSVAAAQARRLDPAQAADREPAALRVVPVPLREHQPLF